MTRKFKSFDEAEIGGETRIIATPKNPSDDRVQLPADWLDHDEDGLHGEWEEAIKPLIRLDEADVLDLDSGGGHIEYNDAVETLVTEGVAEVESQAQALVEYFAENEVLDLQGNQVVLFRNPITDEPSFEMLLNWAAAIESVVEQIDGTRKTIERAKQKLQEREKTLDQEPERIEELRDETLQELKSLGDGPGLPDPNDLSEEELREYRLLADELAHHDSMYQALQVDLEKEIKQGRNELARNLRMLETSRASLIELEKKLRGRATAENEFPDEAATFVTNVRQLVRGVTNIRSEAEDLQDAPIDELQEKVTSIEERITKQSEAVLEQSGGSAEDVDDEEFTTTDLEMN